MDGEDRAVLAEVDRRIGALDERIDRRFEELQALVVQIGDGLAGRQDAVREEVVALRSTVDRLQDAVDDLEGLHGVVDGLKASVGQLGTTVNRIETRDQIKANLEPLAARFAPRAYQQQAESDSVHGLTGSYRRVD
jgi:chromosome segregation ATPase